MDIRKNPWLKDANRKSLVSVRITSLNLHGTGRRRGFVRPTEIFTTMFKMEVRLGRRAAADPAAGHIWTQARTFDEFREFYDRLTTTGGTNAKEKLTVHPPPFSFFVLSLIYIDISLLCPDRSPFRWGRTERPMCSSCWSARTRWRRSSRYSTASPSPPTRSNCLV